MDRKRTLLAAGFFALLALSAARLLRGQAGSVQELAPGVFFRQHTDISRLGSNTGWVEFDDFVLVIDAAFPAGAREVLAEIRARTRKPVRFVFDTHHHGDHAFGNPIYTSTGATAVAHEQALALLRERAALFTDAAKTREDMKDLVMKNPALAFPDRLILDDGTHRVELVHTGWGHTPGDAVAYLPKEKILFTGDACVNGPFNYFGDGNSASWIRAIEVMQKLDVKTVAPGHGPTGGPEVLATQKQYFAELRNQVGELVRQGKTLEQTQAAISIPMFEKWTGRKPPPANVAHVYNELKR